MTPADDLWLMGIALSLARRALGSTGANPAVGCVISREQEGDIRILARAHTASGGRPHAETQALHRAGETARGATAHITLEPCAHHGQTPPCAEALIRSGIKRVVYACQDPDARVQGRGHQLLQQASIAVERLPASEPLSSRLQQHNAAYLLHRTHNRPLVILKLAASLDGRIAAPALDDRWLTAPLARRRVHLLRATCDAILIGSGTALADDPMLTCRLPGLHNRSPIRIVADSRLRLPADSRLAQSAAEHPLWILTRPDAPADRRRALEQQGVLLLASHASARLRGERGAAPPEGECGGAGGDLPPRENAGERGAAPPERECGGARGDLPPRKHATSPTPSLDLPTALNLLAQRGITRLLLEGGATLATSFLRANLVDRLEWFRAPMLLGGDALPAFSTALASARRLHPLAFHQLSPDTHETFLLQTHPPCSPA